MVDKHSTGTAPNVDVIRNANNDAAIIFVHGFTGQQTSTWGQFPSLLRDEPALGCWDIYSMGYSSRLAPDIVGIWSTDAPIQRLADLFRTTVQLGLRNYRALAVVAHSMGGLIVQRSLLDSSSLRSRVSHLFLFGTPSAGLRKAVPFGMAKRQIGDMGIGSRFISELRRDWDATMGTHPQFSFWTVAGERDEFVTSDSSLEPFEKEARAVVPGNHLEIVKPVNATDLSFLVVRNQLIGTAAPAGPWNSARVAVETRQFYDAIQLLEPNVASLDESGLVMLALAYDGIGRSEDAIRVLEAHGRGKLDAMGTLAGRFKRRWISERRQSDLNRALQLYSEGVGLADSQGIADQTYYHAVNMAFLLLATNDFRGSENYAKRALAASAQGRDPKWSAATAGEAELILGNSDAGLAHYAVALQKSPTVREVETMFRQATWIATIRSDLDLAGRLRQLFRLEGVDA